MRELNGLFIEGPVGFRPFRLARKCEANQGHTHNYDHALVVIAGALVIRFVEADGRVVESPTLYPGQWWFVQADRVHEVKAQADNTEYQCVFSHRDFGGLVSQSYVGNVTAYS